MFRPTGSNGASDTVEMENIAGLVLDIGFGDIVVARQGARAPSYDEQAVSDYMKGDNIVITADLGLGRGRATVWTCDLTKAYVEINGDYRS